MVRIVTVFLLAVGCLSLATIASGQDRNPATKEVKATCTIQWGEDYLKAVEQAIREKKYLLLAFTTSRSGVHTAKCDCSRHWETEVLSHPEVTARLGRFVCVRLPLEAKITYEGRQIELLKDNSFTEMLGLPGLAIIDLAHPEPTLFGRIVSMFPLVAGQYYSVEQVKVILDLPSGTLTQRTLIYAVRTHPERPASANGQLDPRLLREAADHSEYQAQIGTQGHHFWEQRFHRINAQLPSGMLAKEVCAESWPRQGLLQAAIECVRCWRLSSGHWGAVSGQQPVFGYDMKRGSNGIWYATGIFGGRQ